MGMWKWDGIEKGGKRVSGSINARNEKEVRKLLRAKGIRPKKLTPPSILEFDLGEWMVENGFAAPFGAGDLLRITKQLCIMVNAGVPILQSLEILYKQEQVPSLKKAVKGIAVDVGEGKTLAEAMGTQKGFNKLYCNLVHAGESGGILDEILNKLAEHLEKQEKMKAQIKSAMTYPVIVVLVGIGVIYGMLVYVVPKFAEMIQDTGQEMPAITQFVLDASSFLGTYSIYIVPGFIVAVMLLKSFFGTPAGKPIYDNMMMKMPIFGGIIIKGNLGQFTRTLSTMLSSGVSLVDSLDICIDTVDNTVIGEDLRVVRKAVTEGKTLTDPLAKIEYFPIMVSQMIKVGEQTGAIDQMLLKISDIFEDEVNNLVANMTKLIEPIILVVLGGIVAVILVAMYMPIFMTAGGA